MNLACPECSTFYRVDPARVPEGGVAARCRECGTLFSVDPDQAAMAPGQYATAAHASTARAGSVPPENNPSGQSAMGAGERAAAGGAGQGGVPVEAAETPAFGPQDPDTRALRLARALVSDIKAYNLGRWEAARDAGTLRREFRDEILKSWDEYLEQVGKEMAKGTPYFRNALNEILAQGKAIF
jgi:predicted Zn finger-like uncharacterized protein